MMKKVIFFSIFMLLGFMLISSQKEDIVLLNSKNMQLSENCQQDLLIIGEEDDDEPFPISGCVKDVNGNPLDAYVELKVVSSGEVIYTTNADTNGNYEFSNIPTGTYDVVVWVNGILLSTTRWVV